MVASRRESYFVYPFLQQAHAALHVFAFPKGESGSCRSANSIRATFESLCRSWPRVSAKARFDPLQSVNALSSSVRFAAVVSVSRARTTHRLFACVGKLGVLTDLLTALLMRKNQHGISMLPLLSRNPFDRAAIEALVSRPSFERVQRVIPCENRISSRES